MMEYGSEAGVLATVEGAGGEGRGPRRNRGGRRGGGGGRGGGGHPLNRIEDEDGDSYMEPQQQQRGGQRYQPYQKDGSREKERVSAFSRLGGQGSGSRGGPRGGGRGRPMGGMRSDNAQEGRGGGRGDSWHKVMIVQGATQSREWLLRTLKESISEPFRAVQIHQLGDKVLFFLEESRAAEEIRDLKEIQSKDGPLKLVVKASDPPKTQEGGRGGGRGGGASGRGRGGQPGGRFMKMSDKSIDGDILMDEDPTQVLAQVLGERFATDTKALNLSSMYHDATFQARKMRASMYDKKIVETILSLIGEHCPDLLALDLSQNRIRNLACYSSLPTACRSLKGLDLSSNEISSLQELEHLQGMGSVVEVSLRGNPCEEQARDFASYSSSVRKYFPNLERLDGQSLPSPVKFDLPVAVGSIPPYVQNYLPNQEAKSLIANFLEQYYALYDSESREKLLEAYSDEALFSLSVMVPENQRDHELQVYFSKSRNLQRLKDPAKRSSLLKHGKIDIVQFVRDLPRTKHCMELFEVDIMMSKGSQTSFVVQGVFSEESSRLEPNIRSFTRTFVIGASGGSVAILNDMMIITTCTSQKRLQFVREKFRATQSAPAIQVGISPPLSVGGGVGVAQNLSASPLSVGMGGTSPLSVGGGASMAAMQEEAIRKLNEATRMNLNYCSKCLSENNWDFAAALNIFTVLQSNNQIPPEAFS